MSQFYIYDLETLVNFFSFTGKFEGSSEVFSFEISDRKFQRDELLTHLSFLQNIGVTMVGYNNLGFDYPILHSLLLEPYVFNAKKAYDLCQQIIGSQNYGNAGFLTVPAKERIIKQVDLMKINHFDNPAKRTGLKDLQFAMRSQSVEDLPVEIGKPLTNEQMDQTLSYNLHDVTETERFLGRCKHLIEMRQEFLDSRTLSGDVLNYSDVKIGVEYLVKKIGRAKCYIDGNKPKQTIRAEVAFKDVILPKIYFRTAEFQAVHGWFMNQTIWIGSEAKPSLETTLAGLKFHFGLGGVHASVENKVYHSNATHVIKDVDVSGMYVAVAVRNGFYPEHLGQDFVTAYQQLERDRTQYPKGTAMNALIKLAGNGAYGNSNNPYSCLFDPKYTFTVTSNGQLQLLQLVELISLLPGIEIIQANTDGITVYMPRELEPWFTGWCRHWEEMTALKLEEVEYSSMWLRDVNNYIAVKTDGEIKRKGAYWYPIKDKDYDGWWNKDFSNMGAQKGVEQVLFNNWDPKELVKLITNPFDFMLRYKTPKGAKVFIGEKQMQKTVRYYVSTKGEPAYKIAQPKGVIGGYKRKNKLSDEFYLKVLKEIPEGSWDARIHTKKKSKYVEVRTSIESGRLIKECNHVDKFDWKDVDYDYYAQEIQKLIIGGHSG